MQVGPAKEGTIRAINIAGLSDQAKSELMARLPVHEGDTFSPDVMKKVGEAVSAFDEHLSIGSFGTGQGDVTLQISAPRSMSSFVSAVPLPTPPPGAIRVGGNTQQTKLITQPKPVYPPLAKEARISGVVQLSAIIGKDGTVKNLSVISGHPLLVQAAMDAVRQWVYEPTLLNGEAVDVMTQIDVNFTLSQ